MDSFEPPLTGAVLVDTAAARAARLALLRARLRAAWLVPVTGQGGSTTAEPDEPDDEAPAGAIDTDRGVVEREPREDGLPEHTTYKDEGCRVAPACLRCPLAHCIYDGGPRPEVTARRRRDQQLLRLAAAGLDNAALAARFALSRGQVRRIRARPRGGG